MQRVRASTAACPLVVASVHGELWWVGTGQWQPSVRRSTSASCAWIEAPAGAAS